MNLFNKLPGFVVTPPGRERTVLRLLPRILLLGTLLLAIPSVVVRLLSLPGNEAEIAARIGSVDIYAISLVVLHWTVLFTVAIAAFIVMVMKGPAYVADAYPLEDSDSPEPSDARSR
jgi:hypothetical protein